MNDSAEFIGRHEKVVHALFERIDRSREELVALIREISEIPAPTHEEGKRTEFLLERMPLLGLEDVHALPRGSVLGYTRSRSEGNMLLLAAHIDTVFPLETDLTTRIEGSFLYGPGTGDNATNVAAVLTLARLLEELDIRTERNIAICGTVCEEGRGGLAGIQEVIDELGDRVSEVIAVDGGTEKVVNRTLAIRRHLIRVTGKGGHAWAQFGRPSAIHEMGRIIAGMRAMKVPTDPKTTFNVGIVRGGTSVNAIAQECEAEVELRSLDQGELEKLERSFLEVVHDLSSTELQVGTDVIDERSGASLAADHRLVEISRNTVNHFGIDVRLAGASMDIAIPLSRGIPSVGFGIYRGEGTHTLEERVDLDSLVVGLKRLALAVLMLSLR